MATEVNQNYFAWSQDESSVQDISQGTTQLFGHGSISFGRFDLESLEWEKWSVFTNDRRHEEFGKFNGLVAKKKAFFEEHFKRVRELKALQQQNQQTELNLAYSSDGSDSSQTGEDEPAADHGVTSGSGTPLNDSREQKIPTTTFEHEVECHGNHENKNLVNEISASTHSSLVAGLQQTDKQVRGHVSDSTDISLQNAYLRQDDRWIANETTLTPKRTIAKEHVIGQASKFIPMTVKMASNNVPARTILPKGPCSSKPGVINQMAKPERRPRGATCDMIGAIGGTGITGLRTSAASQRPSTRERRPITRDASRKPAEVTTPCRPSTSVQHTATRESALKHAKNATPCRPSTPDRRPVTKDSAPKISNIATPRRPSTADRRTITKEPAPKLSNNATRCRPSTADTRPTTKGSTPKQSNIGSGSLHRPSTGEKRPITRDMATKHVGISTSFRPCNDKQRPVTREGARKHADVVTLRWPSTAERQPIARDVAAKLAIVPPPCRPSTAERRCIARDVAPKHLPSCRPSTAERHPVTKESSLKHENIVSSRWPLTPDRYLSKKSETSTPLRPSTAERRPITNHSTLKSDKKTPLRLRAVPNCSKGAMFAAVTPRKAITLTPNLAKSSKPENISYAKEEVEVYVDGKPKSSLSYLPPRKMLTSNVIDDRVLDNSRKANKDLQERVQAQALASNNTTSLQTGSVKTRAPIPPPPPPPPPPSRSCSIERKRNANNLPASGRKPKPSTPRWH